MNKIQISILVAIASFFVASPLFALSQSACTSTTSAYWSFDFDASEGCGGTALDGTFAGSASVNSSNMAPLLGNNGSLFLTGDPDRVDFQAPFGPTIGSLSQGTIESWVYLDDSAGGVIFNHGIAASYTDLNVGVGSDGGGGYQSFIFMPYSGVITFSLSDFSISTWHHLAWTWDGSNVAGYLDGTLISSQSNTQIVPFTGNEVEIGSDDQEVSYFTGRIDEVRISNAVLSSGQMLLPEPISFILFVTGGSLLAGRRYMKRRKKA